MIIGRMYEQQQAKCSKKQHRFSVWNSEGLPDIASMFFLGNLTNGTKKE